MRCVDLFAGLGGSSTGAVMAGAHVLWAANHNPEAVDWHRENHPDTVHVCQDLHQADFTQLPDHDVLMASPCCQGHSKARGKNTPQHDKSRSTAWAVVSALEAKRPEFAVVENVLEFRDWDLFPSWRDAISRLGYSVSLNVINSADFGVPQSRNRLFVVISKSRSEFRIKTPNKERIPASSFLNFNEGRWSDIHKLGRAKATLERVEHGRSVHGERFLISYYGNTRTGRSVELPIGTITTRDRWAIVDGGRMRMITKEECKAAMGFPKSTRIPQRHHLAVHLLGNAVCPPVMAEVLRQIGGVEHGRS